MVEWTWSNKCIAGCIAILLVWFFISLASVILLQNGTSIVSLVLVSCCVLIVLSYVVSRCCKQYCCQPEEIIYHV